MESAQFDRLTRAFGALRTRRSIVRVLPGAAALAALGGDPARAKNKKKHRKPCKAPKKKCGGKCLAVLTDNDNCGACGNRCTNGQTCKAGACKGTADPQGCQPGACCEDNQVCNGDGRCRDGACQPKPNCLPAGANWPLFGDSPPCCGGDADCVITGSGGMQCTCPVGTIRSTCLGNDDCQSRRCVGYQCQGCGAEAVECDGVCVILDTVGHCGACGNACERGEFCSNQACKPRYVSDRVIAPSDAQALFVDGNGTVFAGTSRPYCVRQFSANGAFEFAYGVCYERGTDNAHLENPVYGVAGTPTWVIISDTYNERVQIFARDGVWIGRLDTTSNGSQTNNPQGLALDTSGNIYLQDEQHHRVLKFNSGGFFVRAFNTGISGSSIAIDRLGNLYVSDRNNARVVKIDPSSEQIVQTYGAGEGSNPGQLDHPHGVAVASTGDVFVADYFNRRVQQFKNNGQFVRVFKDAPVPGQPNQQLIGPVTVALDAQNNLYVGDEDLQAIVHFSLVATNPS